ncbi:MAG: hypothetical protein AUG89_03990 [Acidobacteria bacterium 13_1_20CM_4_56_7]|nr:MAG: hypothetical protein AUG89_03990 [Acidobacteria bacterium 13_1_20CM_4_56_7]
MDRATTYLWVPAYVSAVLETDHHRLPARISEVEAAIRTRLAQEPGPDENELEAIRHVQRALPGLIL